MISILATDIHDAFHQLLFAFVDKDSLGNPRNTYLCDIDSGSYGKNNKEEYQQRLQADFVAVEIEYPETRPLGVAFPEWLGVPPVCSEEQIESYFASYLMNPTITDNEDYTYGSRILAYEYYEKSGYGHILEGKGVFTSPSKCTFNQLEWVISHFKKYPNNNHCYIEIGNGTDLLLSHQSCLKGLDFKIVNDKLNMSVYFRSNDLWAAWPVNIGGLQLLNEYIAQELGITTGSLFYASSGLHIYSMYFPMVCMRLGLDEDYFGLHKDVHSTYAQCDVGKI